MLETRSEVAGSSHSRSFVALLLALPLLVAAGCSVPGVGEGEVTGTLTAPGCGKDDAPFDLRPDFFVADPTEGKLEIRVQRGGDYEFMSNGISIFVADAEMEAMRTGTPIEVTGEPASPVQITAYFHETCEFDRDLVPVVYTATSGTITFESIYAPDFDEDQLDTTASFDLQFTDPSAPEERHAELSGRFSFLFNRGRPAQRFP